MGQSMQPEPDRCIGGHLFVPYQQYTQQSPDFGLSAVLQCSHSQNRKQASGGQRLALHVPVHGTRDGRFRTLVFIALHP